MVIFALSKKQGMIRSMTGYGKSVVQLPNKKLTIEIKSLNSKNLDLNTRMPSIYRERELDIRKLLARELLRGKVDFSIYLETTGQATSSKVNQTMVQGYMAQLRELVDASELELVQMAIRMPDAVTTDREDIDEEEWGAIFKDIQGAIAKIQAYRIQEGQALEDDFHNRVSAISDLLVKVEEIDPERMIAVRERLRKAIDDLKENVDENRFEQELIYYIEKFDITEEKVRLKNHLDYFDTSLKTRIQMEKN